MSRKETKLCRCACPANRYEVMKWTEAVDHCPEACKKLKKRLRRTVTAAD